MAFAIRNFDIIHYLGHYLLISWITRSASC